MPATWDKLVWCLNAVRKLNTGGFIEDSSRSTGQLIGIDWRGATGTDVNHQTYRVQPHPSHPYVEGGTCCSPAAAQVIAILSSDDDQLLGGAHAFDPDRALTDASYRNSFRFRARLPWAFYQAAQDNPPNDSLLRFAHTHGFPDVTATNAIGIVKAAIAFGMADPKNPWEAQRGDVVKIAWPWHGNHAGFVWDVHTVNGRVDAILVAAANEGDTSTDQVGFSVSGNPQHLVRPDHTSDSPYFDDSKADVWVREGQWITLSLNDHPDPAHPHRHHQRGVQISCVDQSTRPHGEDALWRPGCLPIPHLRLATIEVARLHGVVGPASMATPTAAAAPARPTPEISSQAPVSVDPDEARTSAAAVAARTRQDAQQAEGTRTGGQSAVQRWLRTLYAHHWISSDPGEETAPPPRAAIEDFQRRYIPAHVDGIAGPQTRALMRDSVHRAESGESPPTTGAGAAPSTGASPSSAPSTATGASATASTDPAITEAYWYPASVDAGQASTLQIHAAGLDGQEVSYRLTDAQTNAQLDLGGLETGTVHIAGGAGSAQIGIGEVDGTGQRRTTTLQVNATLTAAGAHDFTTGAPLHVEPVPEVIVPGGKGWFTQDHGSAAAEQHTDQQRISQMQTAGLSWVLLLAHGDDDATPSESLIQQRAQAYRSANIEVWLWGWPGRPGLGQEQQRMDLMVRLADAAQARGIIVDVEEEYLNRETHHLRQDDLDRLKNVLRSVVSRASPRRLGLGISSYSGPIARAVAVPGSFFSPQWYHPAVFDPGSVPTLLRRYLASYRKVVPTLPAWIYPNMMHPDPQHPDRPQPENFLLSTSALQTFLDRIRDAAQASEFQGKVPALAAWAWEHHQPGFLTGGGRFASLHDEAAKTRWRHDNDLAAASDDDVQQRWAQVHQELFDGYNAYAWPPASSSGGVS